MFFLQNLGLMDSSEIYLIVPSGTCFIRVCFAREILVNVVRNFAEHKICLSLLDLGHTF